MDTNNQNDVKSEIIYGVTQSNYGHEYRWLYRADVLKSRGVPIPALGQETDKDFWPMSGSNVNTARIVPLPNDEEIKSFLFAPVSPDLADPMLVDIAECCASVDLDDPDWESCTYEYVNKLGISLDDLNRLGRGNEYTDEAEKMIAVLTEAGCEAIDKEDPFYGTSRDMRFSELSRLYKNAEALAVITKASAEDRQTSADEMAELLMDPEWSSYKMFEGLADDYINGNEDVRKGINLACSALTGWNLDSIAKRILKRAGKTIE